MNSMVYLYSWQGYITAPISAVRVTRHVADQVRRWAPYRWNAQTLLHPKIAAASCLVNRLAFPTAIVS